MSDDGSKLNGAELIAQERLRQVADEGWTSEHDDRHSSGELAMAAACYAVPTPIYAERKGVNGTVFHDPWPFPAHSDQSGRGYYDWDKRKSGNVVQPMPADGPERVAFLVKAGALIAAEIDRLRRAESASA